MYNAASYWLLAIGCWQVNDYRLTDEEVVLDGTASFVFINRLHVMTLVLSHGVLFYLTRMSRITRITHRFTRVVGKPSVFIPKASTSVARAKTRLNSCLNSR